MWRIKNLGSVLSSFRTSPLGFESLTHRGGTVLGKPIHRPRALTIRAEVSFVNAEEAKKLIAEGYTVLDVRDKSQFDRAHIKSCYHVPLFVENKDNDIGILVSTCSHLCVLRRDFFMNWKYWKIFYSYWILFLFVINVLQAQLWKGLCTTIFRVCSLGCHSLNPILSLCSLLRASFNLEVNCCWCVKKDWGQIRFLISYHTEINLKPIVMSFCYIGKMRR